MGAKCVTMNSKWKRVSKEEFYAFIDSYPSDLHFDTTGIFDPPLSSYNDLSKGPWPKSMVAKIIRNDCLPKEWNAGENEYFILDATEVDGEHALDTIVNLWKAFSSVEFDEYGYTRSAFMHFPRGTKCVEIYDWFDCRYPGGCIELDAIIERK